MNQPMGAWGGEPYLAVDSCGVLLGDVGQRCAQVLVFVAEAHFCFCTAEASQIAYWKVNLHCSNNVVTMLMPAKDLPEMPVWS